MRMSTQRDEPAKRPEPSAYRGAPAATYTASAVRKNLAVRVMVQPPPVEPDELREHGYGHGV